MTATDIISMEKTANLLDRADRLMLADAYADAGMDDMAELVRGDWPTQAHVVTFDADRMDPRSWDEDATEATNADGVCSHDGESGEALCWGAAEDVMDGDDRVECYEAVWLVQDDLGPFDGKSRDWKQGFRDACKGRRWDHYAGNASYLFNDAARLLSSCREAFAEGDRYEEEMSDE